MKSIMFVIRINDYFDLEINRDPLDKDDEEETK